ncbi:amidohydrolase [Flavihumibacter rivuli]|uniref:amidohydrolase n=1 Tax=Flavihumibacter rivuli TaxID=2838156 RepID=UPI001BDDE063|nr:amidohydrolase [Flavihumibacter rivuli]ULQ56051.1 amidohydrolase [Flavihumibacter rivuli]
MRILLLLLLSPLFTFSQDQLFYNARIFTGNYDQPFAEAIAIRNGKVLAVGSLKDVEKKLGKAALRTDLKGQTLLPGMVDSHIHAIKGGKTLTKANLKDVPTDVPSIAAYAQEAIRKQEGMTGDVLDMYGLNISTWSHLDELSKAFNSGELARHPVILRGSDGHTVFANQAMLRKAGVDKAYLQTLSGDMRSYYATLPDGQPSGFVTEDGIKILHAAVPNVVDYALAAKKTMDYANGYGLTAWLEASATTTATTESEILDAYHGLIRANALSAHVVATIVAKADSSPEKQIDTVLAIRKKYERPNLKVAGFKVFADGVLEYPTQTAALSSNYTGTNHKGVFMFEPGNFARFATAADKAGMLVHVHAIGDRAVTETLNGFERVRKQNGNTRIPHSITHMQLVVPTDFSRFRQLNVLTSQQLLWAFGDVTTIDIVQPYIAQELYKWQYPAKSLLDAGAVVAGASDWPVSSANPFEAIYHAETRKGPKGVLDSSQCMPRMAMFYGYTIEAAKVLLLEKEIGSLEPGKWADMVLVDRDVFSVDAESMRDTRVLWTMFEGKVVWRRQ